MSTIYKLPLLLEPQPEGGYTITCPLLPNLVTEADTLEQVIPNVADALAALLKKNPGGVEALAGRPWASPPTQIAGCLPPAG